jgi:lipopolysaccharide transport system permease protein
VTSLTERGFGGAAAQASVASRDWVVNQPTRGMRSLRLGELWAGRDLMWLLAARDLKVRYRQTALGVLWAVIAALTGSLVLVLVFGRFAGVSTGTVPHVPFVIVGFAAFTYFSASAGAASQSLVDHIDLVTKVYFPRLLLPLGMMLPAFVDLGIGLALAVVAAIVTGVEFGWALVAVPLWVLLLWAASAGIGLTFCALNVRFRDVRYVFPLVIQLLFFLSPVAYPASLVHEDWLYVYGINPFAGILTALRWSILGGGEPAAWWLVSSATALALLVVGVASFKRSERRFADII